MTNEKYLGDGLYVSFDGHGFTLRAPRDGGDHWVYLEPYMCKELAQFINGVLRELAR